MPNLTHPNGMETGHTDGEADRPYPKSAIREGLSQFLSRRHLVSGLVSLALFALALFIIDVREARSRVGWILLTNGSETAQESAESEAALVVARKDFGDMLLLAAEQLAQMERPDFFGMVDAASGRESYATQLMEIQRQLTGGEVGSREFPNDRAAIEWAASRLRELYDEVGGTRRGSALSAGRAAPAVSTKVMRDLPLEIDAFTIAVEELEVAVSGLDDASSDSYATEVIEIAGRTESVCRASRRCFLVLMLVLDFQGVGATSDFAVNFVTVQHRAETSTASVSKILAKSDPSQKELVDKYLASIQRRTDTTELILGGKPTAARERLELALVPLN